VADYSIAQFRFLQRLLLVHGRWNYVRTAKFILLTFWKEMFFYMMQALYQGYNGYTGTSLYESWSLTVLNTLFTSLCVIILGIFEQDLSADTLLAVPELYGYGQRNEALNIPKYLLWMLGATIEGIVVWFVCWAAYTYGIPKDDNMFALGDLCFSLGIVWTNFKLFVLDTHHKNLMVLFSISITVGGWWAWNAFLSSAYGKGAPGGYYVRGGFVGKFGTDPVWWLTLLLVFGVLFVMEVAYRAVKMRLIRAGRWHVRFWRIESGDDGKWRLELWQEMERDAGVRERLRAMARGETVNEMDDGNDTE